MGTHHTLINGTAYAVTGGTDLVNGTKYQIGGGRTLVDGTAYDVLFAEETVKIAVHNGVEARNCYVLYNGQRITSGEIDVKIGETIVVYAGSPQGNYGYIYLNSVEVVKGSGVNYSYTVTKNATISYRWASNYASECNIAEE